MPRFAGTLALLMELLWAGGCSEGSADSAPADAGGADRDTGLAPPDPVYECEPNLPSIESGIFKRACAFITCHTSAGYAGSLDLADTEVQKELVLANSIVCPGWKRVVPGSPEASFLWNKLTQDTPACGDRMPLGLRPLPPHALDCVRTWISELPHERDSAAP